MKKYLEFEKAIICEYKRGLRTFEESYSALRGYLNSMEEIGILDIDRLSEEYTISFEKLLEV